MMLADASVLDVIAGKRVIGISSLAISVSSSGLMLLLEKLIFNKHWVHPVLYGPDLQFLPFSGHGHFGASATLSWVLVGKFGVKKALLEIQNLEKSKMEFFAHFSHTTHNKQPAAAGSRVRALAPFSPFTFSDSRIIKH